MPETSAGGPATRWRRRPAESQQGDAAGAVEWLRQLVEEGTRISADEEVLGSFAPDVEPGDLVPLYRTVVAKYPTEFTRHMEFAQVLIRAGRKEEAIDVYERIRSRLTGTLYDATTYRKVEDALAAKGPDASRGAHFVSVLALAWPDGHVEWFEGRAEGTLVWPPRGRVGFGYDPMFVPHGYDETYAELPHETKNAISHRTEAFELLKAAVF